MQGHSGGIVVAPAEPIRRGKVGFIIEIIYITRILRVIEVITLFQVDLSYVHYVCFLAQVFKTYYFYDNLDFSQVSN